MATSGSTDFNLTARQVITDALRDINIVAETEDPGADQADGAMRILNRLLKDWQKYENLWRLTEGSVTLVADDADYTLSVQPHRIVSARYRNASSIDLPMYEMTREEYFNLPQKTSSGIPTSYYVDYQRTSTVLYVWPVPSSVTTETVRYTFQRKFEDIDALDNDIDIRQEHFDTLTLNLAARLADRYGRTGSHIDRIIARAKIMLDEALDDDRESFIQFIPERR